MVFQFSIQVKVYLISWLPNFKITAYIAILDYMEYIRSVARGGWGVSTTRSPHLRMGWKFWPMSLRPSAGPYAGRGRRGQLAPPPPARKFSKKKVLFPHFLRFRPPLRIGSRPPPPHFSSHIPQKNFENFFFAPPQLEVCVRACVWEWEI